MAAMSRPEKSPHHVVTNGIAHNADIAAASPLTGRPISNEPAISEAGCAVDISTDEQVRAEALVIAFQCFRRNCPDFTDAEAQEALGRTWEAQMEVDRHVDAAFNYLIQTKLGGPAAEQVGSQTENDIDEDAALQQEMAHVRQAMEHSIMTAAAEAPEERPAEELTADEIATKFPTSLILSEARAAAYMDALMDVSLRSILMWLLTQEQKCNRWFKGERGVPAYFAHLACCITSELTGGPFRGISEGCGGGAAFGRDEVEGARKHCDKSAVACALTDTKLLKIGAASSKRSRKASPKAVDNVLAKRRRSEGIQRMSKSRLTSCLLECLHSAKQRICDEILLHTGTPVPPIFQNYRPEGEEELIELSDDD